MGLKSKWQQGCFSSGDIRREFSIFWRPPTSLGLWPPSSNGTPPYFCCHISSDFCLLLIKTLVITSGKSRIFIYLTVLGLVCSSCGLQTLSWGMWDLGIEPGSYALGERSLSLWTTREVPKTQIFLQGQYSAYLMGFWAGKWYELNCILKESLCLLCGGGKKCKPGDPLGRWGNGPSERW